jgi:hypothetical protein
MLDDLVSRHLRLGMRRKHVEAILGRGDAFGGDWDGGGMDGYGLLHRPNLAHVLVALARWRSIDPHLAIEFDKPSSGPPSRDAVLVTVRME